MSKVVKVYDSNYKIAVQDSGTITLDTGDLVGTTVITGNLEVKGTTTTVESTEVTINDNIIILSDGTVGPGIPSSLNYISGLEIDRGSLQNARWLFDEQVSWSLGGTSGLGTWHASTKDGQKLPLNTPGIVAQGNLYVNTGAGIITVTGTPDYEEKIFTYTAGIITTPASGTPVIDDDTIPNTKAVVDYVNYAFTDLTASAISLGDTKVDVIDQYHEINTIVEVTSGSSNGTIVRTVGQHGFTVADTVNISGVSAGGDNIENLNGTNITILEVLSPSVLRLDVNTTNGSKILYTGGAILAKTSYVESRIEIDVSGVNIANFYNNRFEVDDIKIQGTTISTTASNQDLTIAAPGTGYVIVKDTLELPAIPHEDDVTLLPTSPSTGLRLYTSTEKQGKVGLFYVNNNNTRDELVSKRRALLFSMLF